jgi:hypothetical protein
MAVLIDGGTDFVGVDLPVHFRDKVVVSLGVT